MANTYEKHGILYPKRGSGYEKRISAEASTTPTAIASSAGSVINIPDDTADETVITTLSLVGNMPVGDGTWTLPSDTFGKLALSASTGLTVDVEIDDADDLDSGDQGAYTGQARYVGDGADLTYDFALNVQDSTAVTALTTMQITNSSGSTASGPVIFGLMPVPGSIDGSTERYASPDMTIQEDNHSTDLNGDLRFACGCAWVEDVPGNDSIIVTLNKETGSPSSGATKTISELLTLQSDWDYELSITPDADSEFTLSLRDVLSSGSSTYSVSGYTVRSRKWRDGPVCKSYVVQAAPRDSGDSPHSFMLTTAVVEFFSGDNFDTVSFIRVQSRTKNQHLVSGVGDIYAEGGVTLGVSSPATHYDSFGVLDFADVTVEATFLGGNRVGTITHPTGTWPADIVGSYFRSEEQEWDAYCTFRSSDTVISVATRVGNITATMTDLKVYPFSFFYRRAWVDEAWWPSVPPLTAQHHWADTQAAQLWPQYVLPQDSAGIDSNIALLEASANNPFRISQKNATGGGNIIGLEPQDGQTETREIRPLHRPVTVERVGDYRPAKAYEYVRLMAREALAMQAYTIDPSTGLPASAVDFPTMTVASYASWPNSYPAPVPSFTLPNFGTADSAHRDHHFYLPYLFTGDYWYLYAGMQEQFYLWVDMYGSSGQTGDLRPMMDARAVRARCFTDASLAQVTAMTPDDGGDLLTRTKSELRDIAEYSHEWNVEKYIDDGSGNTGWYVADNTKSNLNAEDEPMWLATSGSPQVLIWQMCGYGLRAALLRHELGEVGPWAEDWYIRLSQNVVWHITHPDLDEKAPETEDDRRKVMYGQYSAFLTTTTGPWYTWSQIWDNITPGTTPNTNYTALAFAGIQAAEFMGYYDNTTQIGEAYDWALHYADVLNYVTVSSGDPDFADVSSWHTNWKNELFLPRT